MRRDLRFSPYRFSWTEFVVSLATAGVVVAVLFPIFVTARETSSQTSCASNLRELGVAFGQYAHDNDEKYPVGPIGVYGYHWGLGWAGAIYPYVKNPKVYVCPDDATTPVAPHENVVSYVINGHIAVPVGIDGNGAGGAVSLFAEPAVTICLMEAQGQSAVITNPGEAGSTWLSSAFEQSNMLWETGDQTKSGLTSGPQGSTGCPTNLKLATGCYPFVATLSPALQGQWGDPNGRHNGTANYLMLDGHASLLAPSAISVDQTSSVGGATSATFSVK